VPRPHAPLTSSAVTTPEGAQPPPAGIPLRGSTTNQATTVGKIAKTEDDRCRLHLAKRAHL
jgi:hypothetical protein